MLMYRWPKWLEILFVILVWIVIIGLAVAWLLEAVK